MAEKSDEIRQMDLFRVKFDKLRNGSFHRNTLRETVSGKNFDESFGNRQIHQTFL